MNSQIELTESVTLVNKLIDRTRERKLKWQVAEPSIGFAGHSDTSDETEIIRFSAPLLDPGQQAVIGKRKDGFLEFSLIERDPRWSDQSVFSAIAGFDPPLAPDRTVLHVSIETDPSYGYGTQEEADLSKLLANLYELARRSANQIDASVGKAISYLDKIAG
ncbi:MAG TPA: hypothetical protein VND90_10700 [Terracidiphilus sp.]|nr:hypothetical protein [Terracidiphilus sp.]